VHPEHPSRLQLPFGENGGIDPQVFTKGISALDLGWFALHGQVTS
jgi:hypothetical protein